MRTASTRCTPNQVTITAPTYTADRAGAKVPGYTGAPTGPYRCTVQPAESSDTSEHERLQGVIKHRVIFSEPVICPVHSRLTWLDRSNRILTVVSLLYEASGQGASFSVLAEERPKRP